MTLSWDSIYRNFIGCYNVNVNGTFSMYFDNSIIDNIKISDVIWGRLFLFDALISLHENNKIDYGYNRRFNQIQVLKNCIFNEIKSLKFKIDDINLIDIDNNWDNIDNLFDIIFRRNMKNRGYQIVNDLKSYFILHNIKNIIIDVIINIVQEISNDIYQEGLELFI